MSNRPWPVASLAVLYSVTTPAGTTVFGRDQWLNRAKAFTVLFGIVGASAPSRPNAMRRVCAITVGACGLP